MKIRIAREKWPVNLMMTIAWGGDLFGHNPDRTIRVKDPADKVFTAFKFRQDDGHMRYISPLNNKRYAAFVKALESVGIEVEETVSKTEMAAAIKEAKANDPMEPLWKIIQLAARHEGKFGAKKTINRIKKDAAEEYPNEPFVKETKSALAASRDYFEEIIREL